jgi:ArsR family transcriptional regulator, arsenate/arsenite/antimonite-responsive transcriptional repressor
MDKEKASEILKALGHPSRLEIVLGLMRDECSVGEIQEKLHLPQSTISQHLRILRNSGIISARKDGTRRCYSVIDNRARRVCEIMKNSE